MSADQGVATAVETIDDVETNGNAALRPLHEADSNGARRIVEWIIGDQDATTTDRPTIDDVVSALHAHDVGLAFTSPQGFAFVKATEGVGGGYLHYKRITDDEQVRAVADVEGRDLSDVREQRRRIDEPKLRNWVHLSLDTGRLEIVALDDVDVFDKPEQYDGNGGRP